MRITVRHPLYGARPEAGGDLREAAEPIRNRLNVASASLVLPLVALGASVRFAELGRQSYWVDEAYTVGLVRLDLVSMLKTIPDTESTPPLYYLVAWLWARIVGTSEVELRSLSALLGTATLVVVFAIGRDWISPWCWSCGCSLSCR